MRRFCTDILLFCLFLAALTAVAGGAYRLKLGLLRLPPGTTTLICGDSHGQTALSDRVMPGAANCCQSAEHLLYTEQKLRLLLPGNPGVRTVLLVLSYHSFSAMYDRYILSSPLTDVMYPQFFMMLDPAAQWFIARRDPRGLRRAMPAIVGENASTVTAWRLSGYPFWGGYYDSDRSRLSDAVVAATIERHYYEGGAAQGFARYQAPYLERIVRLCAEHHVQLVLVSTPLSPQYLARVPRKFIDHYDSTVAALAGMGVELLDYHDLNVPMDWYGDGDHLNARGAGSFTRRVMAALQRPGGE